MKNRKTKSRLTKVDLDAVLKLQREHAELEQRLTRLLEWGVDLNRGVLTSFMCGDDIIDYIAREVAEIANKRADENISENRPYFKLWKNSDGTWKDPKDMELLKALFELTDKMTKQQSDEATDTIQSL